MKKEFHQILREKMQETQVSRPFQSDSITKNTEPLHLAFLLGQIEKTNASPYLKRHYYNDPLKNSTTNKTDFAELPIPPDPPRHFSLKQKEAWLWFWKRGAPLDENFTHQELQKQFRKLAQAVHPDKNSHPKACETFIQLRDYYQNLGLLI